MRNLICTTVVATTLLVSASGAHAQIGGGLAPGRLTPSGEEEGASRSEVAIEFTETAPRFWHIDFPPADWKLLED